ncbi:MAG: undecaprenyldiphospho-muramoylpentapeptide beta-N-acetylglucosaminyltransferase [Lachnospiraceae bacterium]|nr:undecaprenyldiphospho-muramoylpentapeptide beta-N-acetylglucosaminyltransferase [Lachnospiraceae bacterium]
MKSKKIVLTGGGTAGHVTPNIALLPALRKLGYEISYIGSHNGIEKKLIADFEIPYYGISVGKLRRYFDLKNFTDPLRIIKGYSEAKNHLKSIKPDIVFSKGGFVSVPVIRAAAALKIPCIIHESDITPGLANKMCISAATFVCCNFPETVKMLKNGKAILTGTPIREELKHGNPVAALDLCDFTANKPAIMVIGGSLGASSINETLRKALPKLLDDFQIIHICGKDKIDNNLLKLKGYKQFEYVKAELKDLLALAELVISRAGANSICELLALKKPNLLIPLSASKSRGDQIQNAKSFESQGFSITINDDDLNEPLLIDKIHELHFTRTNYIEAMDKSSQLNSIQTIVDLIERFHSP